MAAKNIYYPAGFQQQVNELIARLGKQGVDLKDEKRGIPSDSKLFRWLVEQELKRHDNKNTD